MRRTLFSVEVATTGFMYPLRREDSRSIWVMRSISSVAAGLIFFVGAGFTVVDRVIS